MKYRKFRFVDMATTDRQKLIAQLEPHQSIESHQTLKLAMEDSEAFVDALLNPPKPNDALKAAVWRYEKVMPG